MYETNKQIKIFGENTRVVKKEIGKIAKSTKLAHNENINCVIL